MIVDLVGLVDRVGPILVFLVAITVVAEICDASGLFEVAAHRGGTGGSRSGRRALAADRRARRGLDGPAQPRHDRRAVDPRRDRRLPQGAGMPPCPRPRGTTVVSCSSQASCAWPWPPASSAASRRSIRPQRPALVLLLATWLRAPDLLRRLRLPWRTVIALCVLFLAVDAALRLGLEGLLRDLVGSGSSVADLLRVSAIGVVSANAVDNLPAYLALEPTVADSPTRLAALLVGVNAGPLVTLWGSVATILWLHRCRAAGLTVDVRRLALSGLLCAVVVVPLATVTLAVTS